MLSYIGAGVIYESVFRNTRTGAHGFAYTESDAEKYPRTGAEILSGGERLYGYIYDVPDSRGVVLMCSGFREEQDCHLPEVFFLNDSGYDVMTFDFTGQGRSTGEGIAGFARARADVDAVLGFMAQRPEFRGESVFLYGWSMGAYAAAAALRDNDDVCGAVCLSAFDRPLSLMYDMGISHAGNIAALGVPFLWLWSFTRCGAEHDASALGCINASGRPVLVMQGASDSTVPFEQSLYAAGKNGCTPPGSVFCLVTEPGRDRHMTLLMTAECGTRISQGEELSADETELDSGAAHMILDFFDSCRRAS